MPTIISTLCTALLLALSWHSAAQPTASVEGHIGSSFKDSIVKEEAVQFVCSYVQEICPIAAPPPITSPGYPAPEPPPSPCSFHLTPEEEMLFKIVEEMPRFPGCEALTTAQEKKQCSDRNLLDFLYRNLSYPTLARENCVEGTVVVQFNIEKDGSITNTRVVRNIGAHFGEEALRVINLMKEQGLKWIPGKQRGCNVRVQYNLPVKFRLECPEPLPPLISEDFASNVEGQEEKTEKADEAFPPTGANPSGTPLTSELEGFRLFPNPTTEQINICFQTVSGPVALSIVNTSGQMLWKQKYENSSGYLNEQINLGQWPAGAYFLHIEQQGLVQAHSFVKQR